MAHQDFKMDDELKDLTKEAFEEASASVGISDEQIVEIVDALEEKDSEVVAQKLEDLSAADTADLLEKVSSEERHTLVQHYGDQFDETVFIEMEADVRKELLESLPSAKVAQYISELDSDDALDLLQNLDVVFQKEVIRKLSGRDREAIEEGLTFPEESAGRLMQREFIAVPEFWTVGKTIDYMREAADNLPEDFSDVFIISPTFHVTGMIPVNRILRSKRSEKVANLADEGLYKISAEMDQEDVAFIFTREDLTSAPVIDDNDRLIGVITLDDIVHVIEQEAKEDFLRLGGIEKDDIYQAVLGTTKARFSWLAINLVTAIMASIVIGFFEATIDQIVALAILLPIVASMGGNAGTQTLTVAVRALATKQLSRSNALRMISKEILVGFLNGILFSVIIFLATWLWFDNILLAGVIAVAMIVNMITAAFFGITIPIMLDRMNIDPALASTVFLTTMTDIVGFFAFLGLAAAILI
jgi:magnesium transporter